MDGWPLVILTGTLLFMVSLVPQVVRTVQLRRAEHISASFIIMVLAASAFDLVYFLHLGEGIAAAGFVANLVAWTIVLWYRLRPGDPRTEHPITLMQTKD